MTVLFNIEDRVVRVTINRPERMNAIDPATELELERIWRDIEARDDISCVVLTGSGERAFCAGADLKGGAAGIQKTGLEYWAESRPSGFGGIAFRKSLDIPVIARVNGFALGGGFEMVLGCDIVIASDNARFGLPEARVGRMPLDGGMVMLQRK
ncbi:MAG: enoyl-CoA hydratase-related protein, partial [Pararhizobium sp.]